MDRLPDSVFALALIIPILIGLAGIGLVLFHLFSALHGLGLFIDLNLTAS